MSCISLLSPRALERDMVMHDDLCWGAQSKGGTSCAVWASIAVLCVSCGAESGHSDGGSVKVSVGLPSTEDGSPLVATGPTPAEVTANASGNLFGFAVGLNDLRNASISIIRTEGSNEVVGTFSPSAFLKPQSDPDVLPMSVLAEYSTANPCSYLCNNPGPPAVPLWLNWVSVTWTNGETSESTWN